jgi:hypothetical protein
MLFWYNIRDQSSYWMCDTDQENYRAYAVETISKYNSFAKINIKLKKSNNSDISHTIINPKKSTQKEKQNDNDVSPLINQSTQHELQCINDDSLLFDYERNMQMFKFESDISSKVNKKRIIETNSLVDRLNRRREKQINNHQFLKRSKLKFIKNFMS